MDDKRYSYFFLGLGLGVAVGILFAPKSGAETRELLREKADESKRYLRRRGEELRDNATEYIEEGRRAVVRQKENLVAAVEAGREAYRESMGDRGPASRPAAVGGMDIDEVEGV
jgi:gas vesicle protein